MEEPNKDNCIINDERYINQREQDNMKIIRKLRNCIMNINQRKIR